MIPFLQNRDFLQKRNGGGFHHGLFSMVLEISVCADRSNII